MLDLLNLIVFLQGFFGGETPDALSAFPAKSEAGEDGNTLYCKRIKQSALCERSVV